jgi:hypothetical protein
VPALDTARRLALTRGVFGSSKRWTYVAIGLYGLRLLQRMATREEETVAVEGLRAGEALLVRAVPAKQARAEAEAEKAARRAAALLAKEAGRRRNRKRGGS